MRRQERLNAFSCGGSWQREEIFGDQRHGRGTWKKFDPATSGVIAFPCMRQKCLMKGHNGSKSTPDHHAAKTSALTNFSLFHASCCFPRGAPLFDRRMTRKSHARIFRGARRGVNREQTRPTVAERTAVKLLHPSPRPLCPLWLISLSSFPENLLFPPASDNARTETELTATVWTEQRINIPNVFD